MEKIERASRAPFLFPKILGFRLLLGFFDPILWISWVIRWRKTWPGFDWYLHDLFFVFGEGQRVRFVNLIDNHDLVLSELLITLLYSATVLILSVFLSSSFFVSYSLCWFCFTQNPLSCCCLSSITFFDFISSFLDSNDSFFCLFLQLLLKIISFWFGSLSPLIFKFSMHVSLDIWHDFTWVSCKLSCSFLYWLLHFLYTPMLVLDYCVMLLLPTYSAMVWIIVSMLLICRALIGYQPLQETCSNSLPINWNTSFVFPHYHSQFYQCYSLPPLFSMAFSPNSRAHASTSRPVQHNWPNPFLRPAANEPPRVVNINGLTITVDRNETHIPVPQPPPQFLNHYHNFCLVGKIFGPPVPAAIVKAKCLANWQGLQGIVTIDRLGNQWFRVEFSQEEDLVYVLENRPWFVKGRIFHMRR